MPSGWFWWDLDIFEPNILKYLDVPDIHAIEEQMSGK